MADTRDRIDDRRPLDDAMGGFPARADAERRQIRPSADMPVVTDRRRDGADPRIGPELRVDDFLVRSCELHELLARVHAVLRQLDAGLVAPASAAEHRHFRFCGWQLDCRTRRLTDPAGTRPVDQG